MDTDLNNKKLFPDTYELLDGGSIRCLMCGRVSFHPEDARWLYCENCRVYHDDIYPPARAFLIGQAAPETKPCLGQCRPDPVGAVLGTGYWRFDSPTGVEGLARERGSRLDVLAIRAKVPRQGGFRNFIAQAKEEYEEIGLWEIWNDWLEGVLKRYGFVESSLDEPNRELVLGFLWSRKGAVSDEKKETKG